MRKSRKTCKRKEKVPCGAVSVLGLSCDSQIASVDVPPNAGITKIYVSIVQLAGAANYIDNGIILISDIPQTTVSFQFRFTKDPNAIVGGYETTFVQPLCSAPTGSTVFINSAQGSFGQNANRLDVTVVYFPDYCINH